MYYSKVENRNAWEGGFPGRAGKDGIMRRKMWRRNAGIAILLAITLSMLAGCENESTQRTRGTAHTDIVSEAGTESSDDSAISDRDSEQPGDTSASEAKADGGQLEVRFGDKGDPFMLKLNGSGTAAAIARHVGTSDWRLPIYEEDEDADYDVMQYYDIPDSYEIPSASEKVTSVKAGEAYYSEPNRIVLFYQDAEVEEEYTPIGSFDATDEFVAAVRDNPVLEGWGNKIVLITKP